MTHDINRNGETYISRREFVFVQASVVDRQRSKVKTLDCTRKLHAVQCIGQKINLKIRTLTCYCNVCTTDTSEGTCHNADYVEPWVPRVLKSETCILALYLMFSSVMPPILTICFKINLKVSLAYSYIIILLSVYKPFPNESKSLCFTSTSLPFTTEYFLPGSCVV